MNLTRDEMMVLTQFRKTIEIGNGEGTWAVANGRLVKLWRTDKLSLRASDHGPTMIREVADGKGNEF